MTRNNTLISRFQRLRLFSFCPWGVAPGFYISRLWRLVQSTHYSLLITFIFCPVRKESRIRNVARVVASSSASVIGAGRPSATTAQAPRVSSAWPLSCWRRVSFFSRPSA